MIVNDFFEKYKNLFYKQPHSHTYYQKIINLPFEEQFMFFHHCYYNLFQKEYNKYSIQTETDYMVTKEEAKMYKDYDDLNNLYHLFIDTFQKIIDSGLSVNKFFKQNNIRSMKYRTFYNTKSKLIKFLARLNVNFENLFYKSKTPKRICRVYDQKHRDKIVEFVDEKIQEGLDNKTNIWIKLSRCEKIAEEYEFSRIAYNTLVKIYLQEKGQIKLSKKRFRTKHEFREGVKEPGNLQADVKVLGKYEQIIKDKVRLLVVRDSSIRLVFSKVLQRETESEIVCALEEARIFFESVGIAVKSIQTDNAMIFKTTNFVYSKTYINWCRSNKIKNRYIKLKHPESNGIVERFNRMIDDEWHGHLMECNTIQQFTYVVKKLTHYYNFERYAHFRELRHKRYNIKYKERYMIPFESVSLMYQLYELDKRLRESC